MKKNKILYIVQADLTSRLEKCVLELIQQLKTKIKYVQAIITQHYIDLNTENNKISVENYSMSYARTCS